MAAAEGHLAGAVEADDCRTVRRQTEMISFPDQGDHSFSIWRLTVRQSSASTAPARCPSASHRSRRRLGVGGPHCDFAMVLLLNDGELGQKLLSVPESSHQELSESGEFS